MAATVGSEDIAALLLDRGADILHRDKVAVAVAEAEAVVVVVVVGWGCTIGLDGQEGWDYWPFSCCVSSSLFQSDFFTYMINWCKDGLSALASACRGGHTRCVMLLVRRGADINEFAVLTWAASVGHIPTVKLLLEMAADVHARRVGPFT